MTQKVSPLQQLLQTLVEGHQLSAAGLEQIIERLDRIEDFLSRIPPGLCHAFNSEFEHEGDARLAWGLVNLARNPEQSLRPFPQDVKDRRITQRLRHKQEQGPSSHRGPVET